MRKTLVALAVVISVVLLQAPAWAPAATTTTKFKKGNPNIYIVQVKPGQTGATRTVNVYSDTCKNKQLAVTFDWGKTLDKKTAKKTDKYQYQYQYQATLTNVPANAGAINIGDVKRATCDGKVLPFTGAASSSLLALGVSLLVIGALLVLSSRRRPLMWRR
jgi:LPXTG-motif cell wall-anchored protein